MIKKILCVLLAVLIFAVPMSVSAVGQTRSVQQFVNLSATVDGKTPIGGEFTVEIKKEVFDDEYDMYITSGIVEQVILKSQNGYAKKVSVSVTQGERLAFTIISSDSAVIADNHTFYAVLYQQEGLIITYENEDGSEEVELPNGQSEYNLVFANKTAPNLTEVKVKAYNDKKISKVYDGNVEAIVPSDCFQLEGVENGADVKLEFTTAKFNDANVKKANAVVVSGFTLSGKDAGRYKVVTQKVQFSAEITPRVITVSAINKVMTLGEAEPKLTYSVSGELVGDDKLIGDLARTQGDEVGTYVITMGTLSLSANGDNYNLVFNEGVFKVSNHSNNFITDKESNVSIKGFFDKSTGFSVTPIVATDPDYKILFDNAAWGKVVSAYNVSLNGFDGDITISFPVPSEYNGKEIAIYQLMSNGAVTCLKTVAADMVTLTTHECTQFMLVADKGVAEGDDSQTKRSTVATIFIVLLIILAILVGLVLIIVALFFGMVFFNKTEELKSIIRGIKKLFKK